MGEQAGTRPAAVDLQIGPRRLMGRSQHGHDTFGGTSRMSLK